MRLHDDTLKTVCFLCVPTGKEGDPFAFHYGGTAFFVSVPSESIPERQHVYMVTAKHNVERASNRGQTLHARLNRVGAGAGFVPLTAQWLFPENPGEDVAVMPFFHPLDGGKPADIEVIAFPAQMFALNPVIENIAIGVGEEIGIVGLFSQRHGTTRNYPIVRTGVISAMPNEPFQDDSGYDYDAYLAEVRSIGGLSGSPVIVVIDPMRPGALGLRKTPPDFNSVFYLLGLVRSHWDLKKKQVTLDYADDELEQVHMGIAEITPIHDVTRVLMSDELKKLRRKVDAEVKKNAPQPTESG